MERAASIEGFLRDPVGHWVVPAPTAIVFCAHAELGGSVTWGRPTREDTERTLAAFEGLHHPAMAARFDVMLDGRAIEGVDPSSLSYLIEWLAHRREELTRRIRVQVGVISDSLTGVTLAGILPTLGDTHAFRVLRDRRSALRALGGSDALCDELDRAVELVRGEPPQLRALRDRLRANASSSIEDVARALAISVRSLQRILQDCGTSFSDEVREARFAVARELLCESDIKIAALARQLGLSENALTKLVRDKTGMTPLELRKSVR
jgi:AraC-like DNA-binding protein